MEPLIAFLAVLGVIAILLRLLGAALALGLVAVEASAARTLSEASARRGDLTGMMERRESAAALRGRRWRAAGVALLWLGLLVVPPLLGAGRYAYAAAALLWFQRLPRVRVAAGKMPE